MMFFIIVRFLKILGVWNMWLMFIWLILCGLLFRIDLFLKLIDLVLGISLLIR